MAKFAVLLALLVSIAAAAPVPAGEANSPSHLNENKPRLEGPSLLSTLVNPKALLGEFQFSGLAEPLGS
ncbi:putative pheromone P-factor (Map2) [Aspergillus clavatus NRRL 1]|uniref:Pheromone P-factor (Map2), putative n=1 Tax=Aspergillus clavatus (strain ATCC 1007 / CBS 513.65 / DSM 816 / NCTC 3887 / NRRL 1 / QM 1276 / 107) TaxID=344612 RepID=A1C6K5_ASPCL|nr:pheromone P-factor (Map2), putative [Aspergillus clavatus NRRL 1]EAW14026.1 pheromone P-factor (Map2), putative [Aspergillus clavatus NRRL 1]